MKPNENLYRVYIEQENGQPKEIAVIAISPIVALSKLDASYQLESAVSVRVTKISAVIE